MRFRGLVSTFQRPGHLPLLGLTVLAACGGETELITPPPPPPAAFVIEFQADAEDAATVQSLGWSAGVPDVDLTLRPADTASGPSRTFRGSPQGSVSIADLPPGRYRAVAERWLAPSERGRLGATDDALGFVAQQWVEIGPGARPIVVMPADRRRSVVISEWAFNQKGDYYEAGFLEIFNNADTTVYLDGMIIGEGWWASLDTPNFPCPLYERYRNDPEGIWSREFQRFPGRGRDHPLSPGGTVVVATDAIDHRPFISGGLDLSGADFELVGATDADNPAVPNLEDIGLLADPGGHGMDFQGLVLVPFLTLPVDVSTLPRVCPNEKEWARFPADRILDAFALVY